MLCVRTIPHMLLTLAFTSHLDTYGGCLIHIVAKILEVLSGVMLMQTSCDFMHEWKSSSIALAS